MYRAKRRGDRESPWRVPLSTDMYAVGPWGVLKQVVLVEYRARIMVTSGEGMPRSVRIRQSLE
jgi:hypothetical protein